MIAVIKVTLVLPIWPTRLDTCAVVYVFDALKLRRPRKQLLVCTFSGDAAFIKLYCLRESVN